MLFNRRNLSLATGMLAAVALTAGALIASTADAEAVGPVVGEPAPAFTGINTRGDEVSLSSFTGSTVVLEWTNHDCPFVRKHYDPEFANMQTLQRDAAEDDIVWLSIISSAPGKQGHVSPVEADALTTSRDAEPAHVVLDESGEIGRLYAAKTTPHMFVINGDGVLVYDGAIDSISSARVSDIPDAEPYLRDALDAVAAGRPVNPDSTKPYGCSVKY